MADAVVFGGRRDVRATLDGASTGACIIACPPHPRHGGDRWDRRLEAVARALEDREIGCLRLDYGPWDEGRGEQTDVEAAVEWARERYDAVGVFGYSFGATLALLVAADARVSAVSALAPSAQLLGRTDIRPAIDRIENPIQLIVGERDDRVDWRPVVDRVRRRGGDVEVLDADHGFAGELGRLGRTVAGFFAEHCPTESPR